MEYIDQEKEKKNKDKDYIGSGKNTPRKLQTAKELMNSVQKNNPEFIKKYEDDQKSEQNDNASDLVKETTSQENKNTKTKESNPTLDSATNESASKEEIHSREKSEANPQKETILNNSSESQGGNTSTEEKQPGVLESAQVDTENSDAYIQSLSKSKPTGFIKEMTENVSGSMNTIRGKEKTELKNSLPELEQPTGLPLEETEKKDESNPEYLSEKKNKINPTSDKAQKNQELNHPIPQNTPVMVKTPVIKPDENVEQKIKQAISKLPTSDDEVNTSPGTVPTVDLSGQADPIQNQENIIASNQDIDENKLLSDQDASKDKGENNIYPDVETEILKSTTELNPSEVFSSKTEPIPAFDQETINAFDEKSMEVLQQKMQVEVQNSQQQQEKMQNDSLMEREKNQREILHETEITANKQKHEQNNAKTEVENQKSQWKEENEKIKSEYSGESESEKLKYDGLIDSEAQSAEAKAETEYTQAETEAEAEKQKTQQKAEQKKEEAKNKDEGFWSKVAGAVTDFFDKLKEGLNALFNYLRAAVKKIIEKAKRAVAALIDRARKAVIGFIKEFGDLLKKIVNKVLAKFPALAKKINDFIDKVVTIACEAVNLLAEALKKTILFLLDTLGKGLDLILAAYQAFYNLLLDGLQLLANVLIGVLKGITGLVDAIRYVPEFLFWSELIKAVFGSDPTSPIPVIEREAAPEGVNNEKIHEANKETGDPSILNKNKLEDEDVEIDQVLGQEAISKEVEEHLQSMDEGEYPFEGVADPVTLQEIKGAYTEKENIPTPQAEVNQDQNAKPDFASMNDDEKLQYYLDQMKGNLDVNDKGEDKESAKKELEGQPMPEVAKVGPLPVSKRIDFMVSQMKIGLQLWWDANKAWLIPTVIAAVVAVIAILIISGGTALGAVISGLMTALTVVFGAMLVMELAGYLWDYVKQSWSGDSKAGGKSLATAFAVGMTELIFTVVFKGIGKLIKMIAKGGKAAFKSMVKAVKGMANMMKKASRVIVRNGKIFFKNIKASALRGVKSIDELTKRLTKFFKLGIGKIIVRGQWILIELKFNPFKLVIRLPRKSFKETYKQLSGFQRKYNISDEVMEYLQKVHKDRGMMSLLHKSDDEIKAAIRIAERQIDDSAHSMARHGAGHSDQAIKRRVTEGVAPDDYISPQEFSSKFSSFVFEEKTYQKALKEIERVNGVDLNHGPGINGNPSNNQFTVLIEYSNTKNLSDGFTGKGTQQIHPVTGYTNASPNIMVTQNRPVFTGAEKVSGANRVFTRIKWDPINGKWKEVQHYPVLKNFNKTKGIYDNNPTDLIKTIL